jgi:hypothetical protein
MEAVLCMADSVLAVDELCSRIEAVGVTPHEGATAGYVRFGTDFALGSVEIAFGDEQAVYDESAFPGVVSPSESLAATVVVSGDGTVAVVDATDPDHARQVLAEATETLAELGLVADDASPETVVPADEIPFALDPPEVETLGYDDGA